MRDISKRVAERWPLLRSCLAGIAVFAGTLAVGLPFCIPRAVRLEVRLSAPVPGGIQVYYRTMPEEVFSEARVILVQAGAFPSVANIAIPARQLYGLRIDFGSAPGDVSVLGGSIGDIPLPPWKHWSFSPDVTLKSDVGESGELKIFSDRIDPYMAVAFRRPIPSQRTFNSKRFALLLTLAVAISLAIVFAIGRPSVNTGSAGWNYGGWDRSVFIGLTVPELAFLLLCASYYTLWIVQPFNFSPDEAMRFEVTRFIFDHGRLPVNEETVFIPWGVSYAHMPTMFCNILGALYMKIAAWFASDATVLLRAARMLGVSCITGALYWTLRVSKLLFRKPFNWLPVCTVAFLPQFAYIGSYVNNDSAALLGCSMVLFSWVSATNRRWTYGNATILAIGIAICATSYYNSYSWILLSLLMFPLTYLHRNGRNGLARMGIFIAVAAFFLGGYLFLRQLHLYGDLLGFDTCKRFATRYASHNYVPGVKKSLCEQGYSLPHMLFGMHWITGSALSFVGKFGKMQFSLPRWSYSAYALIFGVGTLGVFWKASEWIFNWRHTSVCKAALLFSMLSCAAITIGLSAHYSFTYDFEPQGRYCFPALLPIAILSAKGVEKIVSGTVARRVKGVVVLGVCLLLGLVAEASYLFFRSLFY